MAAKLRKHYLAFVALAVVHFVIFFPVLFMGRVISPNDVFFNYSPWDRYAPESLVRVQNSLLNDPSTAYLPLMSLVKNGWQAFHWNPYIGSGIPGFGSSASAVLSPFVFFPALIVPLPWVYTAIILLKLNVAFWFAYFWLREEHLGKKGAAIGAIVIAASGVYTARWLWQITNATALYPALLWAVRRIFSGKRTSIALIALIALSYALAGFPAAMAYGAYLAAAYAIFLSIASPAHRTARSFRALGAAAIGVGLALIAAAPSLVPFIQFLRRSGYLAMRETIGATHYPLHHWLSFFEPQRLGNHALKNWKGDPSLPVNNDIEAAIYVGALTMILALFAIADRRHRRWLWIVAAIVIVLAMFGLAGLPAVFSHLPGFKYTAILRIVLLLPVAAGYLAASGATLLMRLMRRPWLRSIGALALIAFVSGELAVFAGTLHPYLRRSETEVPVTPTIAYLQHDRQPFRFAAMLGYMWPNSAELFRIQDIASHFGSEAVYRKLLQRVDPTSFSGQSTVIQFNSLKFKFTDPLVSMLGVRYFLEHRHIDIIKWTIFAATVPAVKETGALRLLPNVPMQRSIRVDAEPFWAIELPVSTERVSGPEPSLQLSLSKNGAVVWSRSVVPSEMGTVSKTYVPLRPYARLGETVQLRLLAKSMSARLLKADAPPGEAPFYYGRVTIPLIFDRELPDGRIFRNLAEVPRFQTVKRLRKLNVEEFLEATDVDFGEEAVVTDDPVFPPQSIAADATARLDSYTPAEQRITVQSPSGPAFLASSEKLTPELAIAVDGKNVRPVQINALFAGVNVPAGTHQVVFMRRIGRGWWLPASLAALAIVVIAATEITSALRRR